MGKNTSILLGEHYEKFIDLQVRSGRYASASEVIRAALRQFEEDETKKIQLIKQLEEGERSGDIVKIKNIYPKIWDLFLSE